MARIDPTTAIIGLFVLTPLTSEAQDPQPYTVTLQQTGDAALDAALHDTANLVSLQTAAPAGPFALVTRARDDRPRLEAALGSFGYYDAKVAITVAGRPVDDPGLPPALDAATGPVAVAITVQKGPEYHLRRLTLAGPLDEAARATAQSALELSPGAPAHAADVVGAQARILEALRSSGHALARVATPDAALDPAARALDITYRVDPGPRVDLGPIAVHGLDRVNEAYIRQRLLVHPGEPFDPAKIEAARQDLAGLGVFATVRAEAATTLDPQGRIPIEIEVTERARHVVGVNAAYSTDLGATAGVTWSHRNLFGNAEQLNLGAAVTQLGGSASRHPGYNVTAAFIKPDLLARNQTLTVTLQGIKESLDAYDRTAVLAGAQLSRKLDERWTVSAGFLAQQSRVTQEKVTRDYTLLGVPLGVTYDTTGAAGLFEPTHGIKASATVTPTANLGGGGNFTILQTTASTYIDLNQGRSVIALRATIGSIQGASAFQLPPDQRLYAGGSGTVRGYKYQSVGPRFPDNRPTGGTSLGAATVEYRQRFGSSYGAALFVDAGQVGTGSAPFSTRPRIGAGIGARYYTAIGPIRVDLALPLDKRRGDDAFELYIGIGQVF